MSEDKIKVELALAGEYPPGEEWRGKIREALKILYDPNVDDDAWVKVTGIYPADVNRVRAFAHAAWGSNDEWKVVTKYDAENKVFWIGAQKQDTEEEE